MFSNENKIKLSILVLNLFVLNILAVQPVQAFDGGTEYVAVISNSVLPDTTSAATTALATINGGTEVFADFATAGVTKAVAGNKTAYNTAIASALKTKGSSLTLAEVQTKVEAVNAAVAAATVAALAAINGGSEVFADFATAGVTKAVAGKKAAYDTAIATALKTKGSSLTLAEVQTQIGAINAVAAATALAAINSGSEVFADFSTAGVSKAVTSNKVAYDAAIATAKMFKCSNLTLEEVQTQVVGVNATATTASLSAINAGTEVFADFSNAGVSKAIAGNKAGYDTAIISARKSKRSDLTLAEVQTQVDAVNTAAATAALTAINLGTEVFADFSTASISKAIGADKAAYDTAIASAKMTKGSDLTQAEVQTQIDVINTAAAETSLTAINAGSEVSADFSTAGVAKAIGANKATYDAAIAAAKNSKHSDLTLAEVQTQVDAVNTAAATDSLAIINAGTEASTDFSIAGVTNAVAGNLAGYNTAIASAIMTKGSNLTLAEVQTQVNAVNTATSSAALAAINAGTEVFADFATAGVKTPVTGNLAGYDTAIASAVMTKGSSLTLAEVQKQVDAVNSATIAASLAAINAGTEVFADFATAGVKTPVVSNLAGYDTTIATAIKTTGSSLTLSEVQKQIDAVNAATSAASLAAINAGTEVFADFATAGVTKAVAVHNVDYDAAIATAINTKGSSLTLAEVQTQVTAVNSAAATTSLAAINAGTELFADFSLAGITKAVVANKAGYDTAISSAIMTKTSSLSLAEVQTQVDTVNIAAATTSLAAINAGTEVFVDFSTAGISKAAVAYKTSYDTAIASAIMTKGSSLTLAELQTQISAVNTAATTASLVAINAGTEIFADFSTAGVTKAVVSNKTGYDAAIATALVTKGASLTLQEVQTQVNNVNTAVANASLAAINTRTETFANFSTAGITKAVVRFKINYDNAIAAAIKTKGSSLTLAEVQKQIENYNAEVAKTALMAINGEVNPFANFAKAGVTGAVLKNKIAYDNSISTAIKTKGSNLTLAEVQTQVNNVNGTSVITALTAINGGIDVFSDFATAGITGAVLNHKIAYDNAIATAVNLKDSDLTLMEVQKQVDGINTGGASTALSAINGGRDVFADFVTAGVTGAVLKHKIAYDNAIDDAIIIKASSLTLPEVQTQVDDVNATGTTTALTAINGGTDIFADFATAGVTGAVLRNKIAYDNSIYTALKTKGSHLTLAEVQAKVNAVNSTAQH